MKRNSLLQLLLFLIATTTFSQKSEYSSLLIPEELKENANAVIRYQNREITIEAIDKIVVYEKKIVTVLNKSGNAEARIFKGYDDDTKITTLSAKIYDALGNEIKKYSKGKFLDLSAVDGGTLYSDSRVKYVNHTPISYPYTLVFESEYKSSSTGFIPTWFPTNGYSVGIEKSEYKLNNPLNITIRTKKKSFKEYGVQELSSNANLHFILENQPAIKYEANSISSREFMPYLLVAANNFSLKGLKGSASNWKEFGQWQNDYLISGRDILDEETKVKVKNLVKGIEDPLEKAKVIYQFMQDKTRYISVQVGIGGWEPIAANEVDKVGYGDCKGLTNYTKALLDAVGVTSHYSVIWAGREKRNVEKDFFGMQGNHVILNIPNNGNDVWLECTSQTMPFGFLGAFTDDRNVLVITPEGGLIKKTPAYLNKTNTQITKAKISLDEKGNAKGNVEIITKGVQYDRRYRNETKTKKELEQFYKSSYWNYLNNLEINAVVLNNNKDEVVFKEQLEVEISDYAVHNQNNLLFHINFFNRNTFVPKRYRNRVRPLQISRGYKDSEQYLIELPKGFIATNLPAGKNIATKFGNYSTSVKKISDSALQYNRTLYIKEGVYPKEEYNNYRKFRKKIAKEDNLRIEITKK